MFKTLLLLLIYCCFLATSYAQKQANIWYFGSKAGVDFNNSIPIELNDGKTDQLEGCATISDKNGKLLFYTDGKHVWNKIHEMMPNGKDLLGSYSSSQAAIIIPKPSDINLYYIFTTAKSGHGPLCYSLVDLSKEMSLGDVISKNIILQQLTTEKLSASIHKNGKDIWVVAHKWNTNEFVSYLVTGKGVSSNPVISAVGSINGLDSASAMGCLKISPDGTKIASAVMKPANFVEIFDFNNNTGGISNPQKIGGFKADGPYGLEFSPNGKLLYISEVQQDEWGYPGNLYQVPLPILSGDIEKIGLILGESYNLGTLQNGPDGKIYQAEEFANSLHVINQPDTVGIGCDFKEYSFRLKKGQSTYGLPNFIQSYFREHLTISATGNCTSDLTKFTSNTDISIIDSVAWNFGDIVSEKNNISHELNPVHNYNKPGLYNVTATIYYQDKSSTSSLKVNILEGPKVNLGKDTTLYYGQNLILNATNEQSVYLWNEGSSDATYEVKEPGTYWVKVTNKSGCTQSDTIAIKYDQLINVGLPKDTSICVGQTILLDVWLDGAKYNWSTGSKTSSIEINTPGTYWVGITNAYNNRVKRDTILVKNYVFNKIDAIADTIMCQPSFLSLYAKGAKNQEKYNWYDENQNFLEKNNGIYHTELVNRNTSYYVEITNGRCSSEKHRIDITYDKVTAKIANKDTIIDLGASFRLLGGGGKTCVWTPSPYILDDPKIFNPLCKPDRDTTFHLIVFNENGCSDTASVKITIRKAVIAPNAFTPNGDGINDLWVIQYINLYPKNVIYIYNRYGALIKTYRDYDNNWDGTYRGQPLPTGVYYYLIVLNETLRQSGSVTILR